jgi:hypothetical protein
MATTTFLLLIICIQLLPKTTSVTVKTSKGLVTGYRADYGINMSQLYYGSADVFLGIPYAEPPIELLRFQVRFKKLAFYFIRKEL